MDHTTSSCLSGKNEVVTSGAACPVFGAFNNSLVADQVISFLGFEDMKALSLVNRDFCRIIRESTRFRRARKNATVILPSTLNPWELLTILNKSEDSWDRFEIRVPLPLWHIDVLKGYLANNVNFISLVPLNTNNPTALTPELFSFLLRMFKYTSKLMEVHVDRRILAQGIFANFSEGGFQPFQVTQSIQNRLALVVREAGGTCRPNVTPVVQKTPLPTLPTFITDLPDESHDLAVRKYLQFAFYSTNLESFYLKQFVRRRGSALKFYFYYPLEKYIPLILEENQETLKDLSVTRPVWRNEEVSSLSFPVLRTLNLKYAGEPALKGFLGRHNSLEELEVTVTRRLEWRFLSEIGRHGDKLTKLHMKVKDIWEFYSHDVYFDWSFLRGMSVLKDFRISVTQTEEIMWKYFGTGGGFLAALPSNQLEKLSFRGFTGGFWKSGINEEELEMSVKMDLFSRSFTGLKSLRFIRCTNAVDDVLLQFILRELKGLEELEITDCKYLTDFGVTGIPTFGNATSKEVSLSNLRALQRLVIRECPCVTTFGLISSLSLPRLRFLEFWSTAQVDDESVIRVVAQNPQLNKVKLNFPCSTDLRVLRRKWRMVTRRHMEFIRVAEDSKEEELD